MPKRSSAVSSPSVKRHHSGSDPTPYQTVAGDTWTTVGACAITLNLVPAAISAYEKAVAHDPGSVAALCGLSHLLRLNDINMNETVGSQSSIDRLNRALDAHPGLAKQHKMFKELAECYLLVGLNDQAHQLIQVALQLAPNELSLWLLSAQTLIRAGASQQAAGALTRCLLILPESLNQFTKDDIESARAAHAELAAIAAADGNIELSIADLTATLSLPPPPLLRIDEHIALWCALATAKERANDIEGALQACEATELAVGLSPRILITHAYLLLLSNDAKNADHAIRLLGRLVDLERPDPLPEGDFLPWYLLGKAYLDIGEPRAAYDAYQVALKRAAGLPITWLAVGKLYLELKQLPDALAAYSQALRLQMDENSPGTATAWDGLSCVYERCDDQLLDAADACLRLGACFKAMGDTKSAVFFEDRAAQLAAAAKKEAPIPPLRDAPEVPNFLLRDLVALLPAERIAFVLGPPQGLVSQQPTPAPQQSPHQPLSQHPTPQQLYPVPHKPAKLPHQDPGAPGWSPGHPQPAPQYLYQGPHSGHYPVPPPPGGLMPPGPPLPPHASPLNQPLMPNGQYPVGPAGPPPPGYAYGQYLPMQGSGMVAHFQPYSNGPVNNWRQ